MAGTAPADGDRDRGLLRRRAALPGHRDSALPGAPGLGELSERAGSLAARTEDADVRELAEAIRTADRLE